MGKRRVSPCQEDGVECSRAGKATRYSIPDLPEDIWHHIHSLAPLRDAARASCVSRAFLRAWRRRPNLVLTQDSLRSNAHVSEESFIQTADCILRRHSGVGVKTLHLALDGIAHRSADIDSWLQVVVAPGIEELKLMALQSLWSDGETIMYNFPCSLLFDQGIRDSIRNLSLVHCALRPKPELKGPTLRSLITLCLDTVGITGDELGCFLSHSPALERLVLQFCREIVCLHIPCELQQLSSLRVSGCSRLNMVETKAPNLFNVAIVGKVQLFGETMQIKQLSIMFGNVVYYARDKLPSIMPNLETLCLDSGVEDVNTPMLPTKFMYLKHLTISLRVELPPSYDYFSLVSFLDASPSLVTLVLDVTRHRMKHTSVLGDSSSLRQIDERRYSCLKSVKIKGFSSAKSLVEITCHILKSAMSLESLTLDTLYGWRCSEENYKRCFPMDEDEGFLREIPRALQAIRRYIQDKVPATVKLSALGPCSRCHKVTVRRRRRRRDIPYF